MYAQIALLLFLITSPAWAENITSDLLVAAQKGDTALMYSVLFGHTRGYGVRSCNAIFCVK